MADQSTELADKLFPVTDELESEILDIPPERRRLHTETYDFSINTVVEYLEGGSIIIPQFQRGYVWTRSQASRLIESLIIQCPIPVLYLSQLADERMSVIDGNQRLQSIRFFLEDGFKLRGLSAYPELEGLRFRELDPRLQRHIKNRTLRCIVILKDTHPQIQFDVFERLNTGSAKLNAQELRHGLNQGALMSLLDRLVGTNSWRKMTGTRNDKRMKAEELLLRFFALYDGYETYQKPFVTFLNSYTESNRDPAPTQIDELAGLFDSTIAAVTDLLGDHAFKLFGKDLRITSNFNAALFDAQMVSVARLAPSPQQIQRSRPKDLLQKVALLLSEERFHRTINVATSDQTSVAYRIERFTDLLQVHLT